MTTIRRDLAAIVTGGRGRIVIAEPPEWMADALCAQVDPDAFFPENGGSTRAARQICGMCPVLEECREHALATDELWGVWGGLTESARLKLRRADRRDLKEAS